MGAFSQYTEGMDTIKESTFVVSDSIVSRMSIMKNSLSEPIHISSIFGKNSHSISGDLTKYFSL